MATTWLPRQTDARKWLLANGEVVSEPPLEETASGRKVRIAGTNISTYTRDLDSLVFGAVQRVAEQKQTRVWMPLNDPDQHLDAALGFKLDENPKATLGIFDPQLSREGTHLWWEFRHADYPVSAYLVVHVRPNGYGRNGFIIETRLIHQMGVGGMMNHAMEARWLSETNGYFDQVRNFLSMDQGQRLVEHIRDNPPSFDGVTLGRETIMHLRKVAADLLKLVREIDALDTLQVPDLRDPENPEWLDLELYLTNYNSEVPTMLADFLDGAPTMEEAHRLYTEFREMLRRLGVVLSDESQDDLMKALAGNNPEGLLINLYQPVDPDQPNGGRGVDHNHNLRIHLPSGVFMVECMHAKRNEVADRWEEVHTVSQITGEEDVLLAFARAEVARKAKESMKKAVKARQGEAE